MNPNATETRTLADIIMERIHEHDGASTSMATADAPPEEAEGGRPVPRGMDPKAVEVYTEVGRLLTRYSAGKVPKAFKIIPSLSNWEEVLFITNPEGWSPHAMYQATRLFASNLNPKMAQRFYNLVLLPAVRDDVRSNKRLHFAYFQVPFRAASSSPVHTTRQSTHPQRLGLWTEAGSTHRRSRRPRTSRARSTRVCCCPCVRQATARCARR